MNTVTLFSVDSDFSFSSAFSYSSSFSCDFNFFFQVGRVFVVNSIAANALSAADLAI